MSRNNLLAALAVLVLVIAAVLAFWRFSGTGEEATTGADATRPAAESAGGSGGGAVQEKAPVTATAPAGGETAAPAAEAGSGAAPEKPVTDEAAGKIAPSFDIVRVEPDGSAVIAGRAAPGAQVRIIDGEKVLGTVTADARGEWVFVPDEPLAPGDRELSLVAVLPDGGTVESEDVVVLSVPGPAVASAAGGGEGEDATAGGAGTSDTATSGGGATPPRAGPVAVLTPRGGGASRVLQGPVEIKPIAEAKGLNLWAVDYVGATGRLTMSGVAEPQSRIFLYLDNEFLGEARADAQGNWRLTVTQDIAEGEYPMRVDLVGEDGEVLARLEVPFIYLPQGFLAVGNRVTVRPGNSLWRIARRVYGEGVQYTTIYDANKAQIVDPDIIYPGQVFYVPGER